MKCDSFMQVLNQVCALVDDSVRDPIVLSIFHASLAGLGTHLIFC